MSNIFDGRCSKIDLRHQFENVAANNSWNVRQWRAQLLMALVYRVKGERALD